MKSYGVITRSYRREREGVGVIMKSYGEKEKELEQ